MRITRLEAFLYALALFGLGLAAGMALAIEVAKGAIR
jgi:hypothetical protein